MGARAHGEAPPTKLEESPTARPGQAIARAIEIVRTGIPRLIATRGRTVGPVRLATAAG
jgi:hypothetical protein